MQRIRTFTEVVLSFRILMSELYKYQEIREKALILREQGLSYRKIAKILGTDDKMVRKALRAPLSILLLVNTLGQLLALVHTVSLY